MATADTTSNTPPGGALFIFRRDLRTVDNVAFNLAQSREARILCIFIFNRQQTSMQRNPYFSRRALTFMNECLAELSSEIPLHCFEVGSADDEVALLQDLDAGPFPFERVYFNRDYTPFARSRDERILQWCSQHGKTCLDDFSDYSLVNPHTMSKPYLKYTPFLKKYLECCIPRKVGSGFSIPPNPHGLASKSLVRLRDTPGRPRTNMHSSSSSSSSPSESDQIGGRSHALKLLNRIRHDHYANYEQSRDDLSLTWGTTRLSSYLKFGCVSVREVLSSVIARHGPGHGLVRELMWRAFYDQVIYHNPHVIVAPQHSGAHDADLQAYNNLSLKSKYDIIKWSNSEAHFKAWCSGTTGFPLVDAGMRQLLQTGYMHNRLRMLTASFLVKVLHVDWRWGERFYAQQLTDYHPSANSGGWQWAAGCGADSQPYLRIFSPWVQAKKFDRQCVFSRLYLPELKEVPTADILAWGDRDHSNQLKQHVHAHDTTQIVSKHADANANAQTYPLPIVDYRAQIQVTRQNLFKPVFADALSP